jgi:hypothetical protein
MTYITMFIMGVGIVFVGFALQFVVTGKSQAFGLPSAPIANRREEPRGYWINVVSHLAVGVVALGAVAMVLTGHWAG